MGHRSAQLCHPYTSSVTDTTLRVLLRLMPRLQTIHACCTLGSFPGHTQRSLPQCLVVVLSPGSSVTDYLYKVWFGRVMGHATRSGIQRHILV